MKHKNRFQSGFIALTSAIIISIMLLAITLAITFSAYFARFNVVDSESKERSVALAEACGNTAILKIAQDPSYLPPAYDYANQTGGELINLGSTDNCTIVSVTPGAITETIKTRAITNKAYTGLKILIDSATFEVKSWDECPVLTNC